MNHESDLEDWLAPRSSAAGEPTAEELFAATRSVVVRRARFRGIGRALVPLLSLGIGYGFGTAPTKMVIVEIPAAMNPAPEPPAVPMPPVSASPEPTAAQLEMQAELSDDPVEVAALYRKAGDKYLNVNRDYPRATRCYRLHLQHLNQPNPQLQPDDSWLLASLKPLAR